MESAASEWFEKYGATVYRRCRRLLGEEEAARDAVQEVFLRVLTRGETYRGDSTPVTWLYGVATRHCLQVLRNQARRRGKLELLAKPEAPAGVHPIDRLALTRILRELDPETAEIVVLRHLDGLTLEEVAAASGYSRKTVQKRLGEFRTLGAELFGEAVDG